MAFKECLEQRSIDTMGQVIEQSKEEKKKKDVKLGYRMCDGNPCLCCKIMCWV